MALHLHRSDRTATLADGLADLLAMPTADPFARDVVAVPAKGVERWLAQRLSHRLGAGPADEDGVCAAVDFRTPWSLIAEVAGTRDADPWAPEVLTWPVLAAIDASVGEPWAAPLARHLGSGGDDELDRLRQGRRVSVARRLSGLFGAYAVQRPTLLAAWEAGLDEDGLGAPLAPDLRWQAPLWRAVVAARGLPTPGQRHTDVCARLRADPTSSALPQRLSLFGHTRLALTDVELLSALGAHREVHLWLPHPSPALWDALAAAGCDRPVRRVQDSSNDVVGHPLLASLGRDIRELQRTLTGVDPICQVPAEPVPRSEPTGLLGWLQDDLRAARQPRAAERAGRTIAGTDHSVQVHACHGPARQVEVLREVLLGLLADDPSLQPRDILVMCPDVEAYAALIEGAFGLGAVVGERGHPAHRLRVRLADRALAQTNPLLDVLARVLELARGRATAAEVLDLARTGPVRRRFALGDDELARLADWVRDAGVRWGLDAAHREPFGLGAVHVNTWRSGLDRVLAGAALSVDSPDGLGSVVPLDDVGSTEIELAGKLAELLDRLRLAVDRLSVAQPLEAWVDALEWTLATLTAVPAEQAWARAQAHRELAELRASRVAATSTMNPAPPTPTPTSTPTLLPSDLDAVLASRLAGRPTRANFRTGTLTVCTMVPMRSVPHRVVVLLGLDDGVFPRAGIPDGDDVLARDPVTGERDARSEDRQLLLDAVLAAGETLVVTYSGADPHTGQPRPPAVPLGELLDALDATAQVPAEAGAGGHPRDTDRPGATTLRVRDLITTYHPLQSFDPRNFAPSPPPTLGRSREAAGSGRATAGPACFSFDRDALAAAQAAAGIRTAARAFLDQPLPALPPDELALDDLLAFVRQPVAHVLRRRLDLALPRDTDQLESGIPLRLDHLQQWKLGDTLLADLLAGRSEAASRRRLERGGAVPPTASGRALVTTQLRAAGPMAAGAQALRRAPARAVDIDVQVGGHHLVGTVPEVYATVLAPISFATLSPARRLESWVRWLALRAMDPTQPWAAYTLGRPASRDRGKHDLAWAALEPRHAEQLDARAVLADLAAIYDEGMREPLPLVPKASERYAVLRTEGRRAHAALHGAIQVWEGGAFPERAGEPAYATVWGPDSPLPGGEPTPDGDGDGEPTRFGRLAMRLWSPVLSVERTGLR